MRAKSLLCLQRPVRRWLAGLTIITGHGLRCKLRGLHCGGNWNNGANAGLGYRNFNESPANSNANIGARAAPFGCMMTFLCSSSRLKDQRSFEEHSVAED